MLDREGLRFLLEILEGPEPVVSARVVRELHPDKGAAMVAAGLLVSDGHELAVADGSEAPVTAIASDDAGGFGYFSGQEGWVEIDPASLGRFRVDLDALARNLLPQEAVMTPRNSKVLVDGLLWDLARLDRAGRRVEVWLGRRLFAPEMWSAASTFVQRGSPYELRLILTSTPADRLPEQSLPGAVVCAIEDVISLGAECRIQRSTLLSRLSGAAGPTAGKPIQMSPDGCTLLIAGEAPMSFGSEIHLHVIRRLVEGYESGKRFNASRLLKEAGANVTTFDRAFGARRWVLLRRHLRSSNGLWGLEP